MIYQRSKSLPVCPLHPERALLFRNGQYGPYYTCTRPGCTVTASRGEHHPLWYLNDQPMRDLRKIAHERLDYIWREARLMQRGHVYALLAQFMKIERRDCHLKHFDEEQLRQVIEIATWMLAGALQCRAKGRKPFDNSNEGGPSE